jgi:GNAT superfamily N-acetyltransferase
VGRPKTFLARATKIVYLAPCDNQEYVDFASRQVGEYADQLARADEVPAARSLSEARERLQDLSADRLRPLGHDFLVARSVQDAARVGWVWLSPPPSFLGPGHEGTRWLSQLTVEEPRRRQGWGRAILDAVERYALARGSNAIWLRVFDWNVAARHLYRSQGYELGRRFSVDAHLYKRLSR